MSHFTVLVISPKELTDEVLEPILQPWHEYECDGVDDQYVIDVDVTDEVTKYYNEPQKVIVMPDGSVYSRWDDRFYTTEPVHSCDRKEFALPDGATEKEMSADEARQHAIGHMTLAAAAESWCGGVERDGRIWQHTNPNKKWDGWTVGGRWTGMFAPPGYDPETDPENQETCFLCHGTKKREWQGNMVECNACGGKGIKAKWPSAWRDVGNRSQLKDIPLEAIRNHAEIEALKRFDKAQEIIAGRPFKRWEAVKSECDGDIGKTREAYWSQPVIEDLTKAELIGIFDNDESISIFWMTRAERATRARRRAIQTFAIVKDGQWYERGSMGWFGRVADEKDPDMWDREFATLLDGLPPETWLAVVDCHI